MTATNAENLSVTETDKIIEKLSDDSYSAEEVLKTAIKMRSNFHCAEQLFKISIKKFLSEGKETNKALIFLIALYINNRIDPTQFLKRLEDVADPQASIVRGFNFFLHKSYEDALHEFSKINYKVGMNLCAIPLRNKKRIYESQDKVLISFLDSRNWTNKADFEGIADLDFLYRIGMSDKCEHKEGVDAKLVDLKYESSYAQALKEISSKLEYKAEVFYAIGKIYHKLELPDKAKEFYAKSLKEDEGYLPALFNLNRINKTLLSNTNGYECMEDYNAILGMNNGSIPLNIDRCSKEVRKMVNLCASTKNSLKDLEHELQNKNSIFSKPVILNNLGVLTHPSKESVDYFKRALETETDELMKNHIKYNLGIATGNISLLKESNLPEAAENIIKIEFDPENCTGAETNKILFGFLYLQAGDFGRAREILEKIEGEDFLRDILLGGIYAQSAEKEFKQGIKVSSQDSFYCLNNLAVIYARKGFHAKALTLYSQLEGDVNTEKFEVFRDELYNNIGNVHLLMENYPKAFSYFFKTKEMNLEIIRFLAAEMNDLSVIEKVIGRVKDEESKFFYGLKIKNLAEGSFKQARNFAEEVGLYEEMKEELDLYQNAEKERIEKIREIEEFRKKRKSFN